MDEKNKRKQIAKISIFITSIFVIFMSVTYGFISMTIAGTKKQVITAGTLDLILEEDSNNISLTDALPMYDEVGMIQDPFTFRLVNNGTNDANYIVKLVEVGTGTLTLSDVKYGLEKDGAKSINLLSTLTDGVIDSGTIKGNQTINYTLRLWIKDTATDNSAISGKSLSYKVNIEIGQIIEEKNAYTDLIKDADTTTVIDYSQISSETNGRGFYKLPDTVPTETGSEDIYYFRGKVENNHVKFANFCWEIVRTTETGGIKMIYDGVPAEDGSCNNTGAASQLASTSAFNSNYTSPADVGYMYGTRYERSSKSMSSVTDTYYYGNDIEYKDGVYTLKDTMTSSSWSTDYKTIGSRYHYTCLSTSNTCSTVYYIHYAGSSTIYYLTLKDGKDIEDAKNEMFTNTNNSKVKTAIDTWYEANMIDYTSYLEDTVWCNDRILSSGALLGKDSDGTGYSYFSSYGRLGTNKKPSLVCQNENDKFTVDSENGNGALTYPVGLITADEISLAGGVNGYSNSDYYLYTGNYYWTLSPYNFGGNVADEFGVNSSGYLFNGDVDGAGGMRPAISLKYGTTFQEGGDGTETNPYVVVTE